MNKESHQADVNHWLRQFRTLIKNFFLFGSNNNLNAAIEACLPDINVDTLSI